MREPALDQELQALDQKENVSCFEYPLVSDLQPIALWLKPEARVCRRYHGDERGDVIQEATPPYRKRNDARESTLCLR